MQDTIKKVARLAKLNLPPEKMEDLTCRTKAVIDYFDNLKSLDTSNVSATSHVEDTTTLLRNDEPRKFEGAALILEQAPKLDGSFIQVPKVIEEDR